MADQPTATETEDVEDRGIAALVPVVRAAMPDAPATQVSLFARNLWRNRPNYAAGDLAQLVTGYEPDPEFAARLEAAMERHAETLEQLADS